MNIIDTKLPPSFYSCKKSNTQDIIGFCCEAWVSTQTNSAHIIIPCSSMAEHSAVDTLNKVWYFSKKMPEKRKYADRRENMIQAVSKRRLKIKQMAIEYKGGRCTVCSYDREVSALEFHHLDDTKKDFGLSQRGLTRSWKRTQVELDKCILVCANCHREIHSGKLQLSLETTK